MLLRVGIFMTSKAYMLLLYLQREHQEAAELLQTDDKKVIVVTRVFSELLFFSSFPFSHPSIAVKTAVLMLWFMEHKL